MICQSVNLSWKITFQNAGYVFTYFCGRHKEIFGYNFAAALKMKREIKTINWCFPIDDGKLLEKYKTIWTKTEDFKNNDLNALRVYDDTYIKTKIKTYGDKVCTNFRGLNVSEDDAECESFTVIPIDSLFVYKNKYYQQVYLASCAHKIVDRRMTNYLGDNPFETDED